MRKRDSYDTPQTVEEALGTERLERVTQLINDGLPPAQEVVSCRLANSLRESFIYLYENRNNETREIRLIHENFVQLYNCAIDTFQRVDLDRTVQELLPLFEGIRLSQHLGELENEQELFSRAGLNAQVVADYGTLLDEGLPDVISEIRQGKYDFSCVKLPDNIGYIGSHEGNSWDGFLGFLSGAVLVADAVCTIPTAGLAAASIVVGAVGAGAAIAG